MATKFPLLADALPLLLLLVVGGVAAAEHRLRHSRVIGPGHRGWPVQQSPARARYPVTAAHCYSCANYELRAYWYHLQMWYNTPQNFTDRCVTMERRDCHVIAMEPCQHQCVTLKQQKIVGGQSVGYHVIRGCLSSLFRWNVLEKSDLAPVLSKPRDLCFSVKFSQLLPDNGKVLRDIADQKVHMCVCRGDRCNGARARLSSGYALLPLIAALLVGQF